MAQGYCSQCKVLKEIKDAKNERLRNGIRATTGKCPDCGANIIKTQGD